MKKADKKDEMRAEYDFSAGVRGKYAACFAREQVMVVLDPDVSAVFSDSKIVNETLRPLAKIIRTQRGKRALAKS
jgi:hypothetical protein